MDSDTKASELDPSDMEERDLGVHAQSAAEGDLPARNVFPFG